MQELAAVPAIVDLATVERFGAEASVVTSPLAELRPELRPLLQRIASLEQRNRELQTLAQNLELSVRELAALVYVDALTGLANRRGFDAALESELRRAARADRPVALLLCDLDHFKHCNDTYGHSHGDLVLARIATLLKEFCKREGDCAARYGGEEFALLLPGVGCKKAVLIADRLRQGVAALSIPHGPSQTDARVTISIGVTSVQGSSLLQGRPVRHLVEAADAALYRAKGAGRNRTKYQTVDDAITRRIADGEAVPGTWPRLREWVVGDTGIEPVTSPV